jgi:hypothetical protein
VNAVSYAEYTDQLAQLIAHARRGEWESIRDEVTSVLDGRASDQTRALIPRQTRRAAGAFFTTGAVREGYARLLATAPQTTAGYWDPTCGAGDLLLAASENLSLSSTPIRTIRSWSRLLRGHDLYEPFILATRMRLVLAVLLRHHLQGDTGSITDRALGGAFERVTVADGLAALNNDPYFAGNLLLNPPFAAEPLTEDCAWSTGRTSQAAVFSAAAAERLKVGGQLTAILPDVLRAGSRYAAWRGYLEQLLTIDVVARFGQFDAHTDVDVFFLTARRSGTPGPPAGWWPESAAHSGSAVGDYFEVRVGAVVDFRDPRDGPPVPYLTARDLPPQGVAGIPNRTRGFAGGLMTPPFVAMRRTSRPGQGAGGSTRGAGVLILGEMPIAVDNHVIVLRPLDGSEDRCRDLLKQLDQPESAAWLDERIRCRHLTVRAVRELPFSVDPETGA